jgi:hypothetical protein
MEGDGPTGAFVLPNYYQIKSELLEKEKACARGHPFHPMYHKMISKLDVYLDEALKCKTLVMATLLHPTFRLKIFQQLWPSRANDAKRLLERHFTKKEATLKQKEKNDIELLELDPNNNSASKSKDIYDKFNAPQSTEESKELEVYITHMDRLQGPSSKEPKSLLIWWKVFLIGFFS